MKRNLLALALAVVALPVWAAGPLDVTSDRLEVDQHSGKAVFIGNVKAVRDALTVTANRAVVDYGSKGDLNEVTATGNVVIVRKNDGGAPDDTARGDQAVYHPDSGKLVLTGGTVLLTRGGHTVQGNRLDYDTRAGQAVMQAAGSGRVQAHFQSGEGK